MRAPASEDHDRIAHFEALVDEGLRSGISDRTMQQVLEEARRLTGCAVIDGTTVPASLDDGALEVDRVMPAMEALPLRPSGGRGPG
ncbi:MAG: hypothetical protein AB7P02_16080 [Alphaproteobacteria bacterium]